MHPTEVDQGVTLAGRYRVAELLAEAPGDSGVVAQTWRAIDEVLSRSVVIHVLAADDPRADRMLEASMRAATVSDVRFLRVLDALREDGIAYVVREWVQGRSLVELLADGPLPPRDAGLVVREVAEALSRAHDQELFHERLDPDSVVVTDGGTIKIVGLATQAALSPAPPGQSPTEPGRADALGLGRLLYTALTARWPAGERSGLAGAPRAADGTLLSPRQCRAGVPRALDEITERILSDRPRHGGPIASPREIVDALTGTVGSTPPEGVLASSRAPAAATPFLAGPPPADQGPGGPPGPPGHPGAAGQGPGPRPARGAHGPGGPGGPGGHGGYGPPGAQGGYGPPGRPGRSDFDQTGELGPPPPHDPRDGRYRPQRAPGPRWPRIAMVLVAVVLFIGVGLLGWQLVSESLTSAQDPETTEPSPTETEKSPSKKAPQKPHPLQDAGDFDPLPEGNGEEHPDEVEMVLDDDPGTFWRTMNYYDPLSDLKPGVGLWVDLGADKQVGEIKLTLLGEGTDLQILAAPEGSTSAPESFDEWTEVGHETGAGEVESIQLSQPVKTRFVLVWLTELPGSGSDYRGGISEIVVRP